MFEFIFYLMTGVTGMTCTSHSSQQLLQRKKPKTRYKSLFRNSSQDLRTLNRNKNSDTDQLRTNFGYALMLNSQMLKFNYQKSTSGRFFANVAND